MRTIKVLDNGRQIAYISTELIKFTFNGRIYLRITDLFVDLEYQGRGIATKLIKIAASRDKHDAIEVVTQQATGFYEKLGFKRQYTPRLLKIKD